MGLAGRPAPHALSGATGDGGRFLFCPASSGGLEANGSAPDDLSSGTPTKNVSGVSNETTIVEGNSASPRQKLEEGVAQRCAAPGWDDIAGQDGSGSNSGTGSSNHEGKTFDGLQLREDATKVMVTSRQVKPVSADGERSFLEAFVDGGHSPATAIAAGFDRAASAKGVQASVVAKTVKILLADAMVVLGPVIGRVTQRSAAILVEVCRLAAVGCLLTDGVTGKQHRQVKILLLRFGHTRGIPNLTSLFNPNFLTLV